MRASVGGERARGASTAAPAGRARAAAAGSARAGQGEDNRTAYWCPGCQRGPTSDEKSQSGGEEGRAEYQER